MVVGSREPSPFGIFASFERVHFPARGRDGGGAGAKGELKLESGEVLKAKGFQVIPANERLIIQMPGGGGYGDPITRDPDVVADDVRNGLVTADQARADYGVVVAPDGSLDAAATEKLRAST
jgi:N-methylhydantoinase B